jgi:hypothetical protein
MSDSANDPTQGSSTVKEEQPDDFALAIQERAALDHKSPADAAGDTVDNPALDLQPDSQPGSSEAGGNDPTAGAKPPVDAAQPDIWRDAPQHLREAYETAQRNAEYRITSVTGRLSALDRQLAQLKSGNGQASTPVEAPVAAPAATAPTPDELAALAEDYPEIAGPLLKRQAEQDARLARLEAPIQQLQNTQATAAVQSQISVLEAAHPDWRTYTADDRYPGWLASKPAAFSEAGKRAVNLEDGAEAAWLLGEFKKDIGATPVIANSQPEATQTQGERRARQLAAGRDGGRSTAPVTSGVPNDFDAAASHYGQQRDRARSRPF